MPQADLRDTNGYDQATYDKLKSYLTEPGDLVPRRCPDGMKYMDCREYECPETHFMNKQRHVCEEIDEQEQTLMMLKSNLLLAGVILAPTALVSHRVYKNHGGVAAAVAAPVSLVSSVAAFGFGFWLFPPAIVAPLVGAALYSWFARKD